MRTIFLAAVLLLTYGAAEAQQTESTLAAPDNSILISPRARFHQFQAPALWSELPRPAPLDTARLRRKSPSRAAIVGAVLGAGAGYLGYRFYYEHDPYCREADMFGCEIAIPIFVIGGAGAGALIGYLLAR